MIIPPFKMLLFEVFNYLEKCLGVAHTLVCTPLMSRKVLQKD